MRDAAIDLIADRRLSKDRAFPLLVAIDGGGGAGKSTLAASLKSVLDGVAVVHGDDFYRPLDEAVRHRLTPEEGYASLFEWQRLEAEVAVPLVAGRAARYHRYDWEAGCVSPDAHQIAPAGIVLIEGVYSLRPELRTYWDVGIYVAAPRSIRMARMADRSENTPSQIERWEASQAYYETAVNPAATADLVIDGG
jgi:uridine kinase